MKTKDCEDILEKIKEGYKCKTAYLSTFESITIDFFLDRYIIKGDSIQVFNTVNGCPRWVDIDKIILLGTSEYHI